MANVVYNQFKTNLMSGNINIGTANIMVMLVSGSYVPNIDTHANTGSITAEVSSPNYSRGGKKIPNTSVLLDTVDDEGVLSGSPVVFSGLTCSPGWAVVYVSGASVATNYLVLAYDLGTQTITNADFTINWNSEGIWNLT